MAFSSLHRALGAAAALSVSLLAAPTTAAVPAGEWRMYTSDVTGSRVNPDETVLSAANVGGLRQAWRYQAPGGPVYGTPAVSGGTVYAADVSGFVFALDAATGAQRWLTRVGTVTPYPFQLTASPLVTDTAVVVGDLGGTVYALDRATGAQLWSARPNTDGYPAIWGAPSITRVKVPGGFRTLVLVPVSSNEETYTATQQQPCCSSRGSVAALDPATGAVVWQAYMVTDAEKAAGASGATIWTQPVYDDDLNLVYVSTGNNYGNTDDTSTTTTSDAIVAINAATGAIVWTNQRTPDDTWVIAYPLSPEHPDADFGDAPAIYELTNGTKVVAAAQKSGFLHVVDAATGALVSQGQFLPGGGLGGFFSDAGVHDGVVFANGNDWPDYGGGETGGLLGPLTGSAPPNAGHVVAVRANVPGSLQEKWRFTTPGSPMLGAVAIANGLVYVHASKDGVLYALDEATGAVRGSVKVGPAINGPAVSNGRVYLGYGDVANLAAADPTQGGVVALAP